MPTPRVFQPGQPGCIEVVFHFTLFSIPLVIVITVCLDSGLAPNSTELAAVAGAADFWANNDLLGVLSEDLKYLGLSATDISVETGGQVVTSHGAGTPGGVTSKSLPSQLAGVVSLYTPLRGKSYRGRSFVPGIPAAAQSATDGVFTTADVAAILTAYNQIGTRLAAVSAHQAVLSRRHLGVKRTTAIATVVSSRTMDNTFDTQRRRSANSHK